ncbi:MAG: hypothetical protein QG632_249, partial [Candidatus Dependentiae bacterium]|nr:hypothetical protein [Candidatus Dependentiae bacterium]
MNIKHLRSFSLLLTLALATSSLHSTSPVADNDVDASILGNLNTNLKENKHKYAIGLTAAGLLNLAYLFKSGKLSKAKLKKLFDKENRAATRQLFLASILPFLLAGGIEWNGYGYSKDRNSTSAQEAPKHNPSIVISTEGNAEENNLDPSTDSEATQLDDAAGAANSDILPVDPIPSPEPSSSTLTTISEPQAGQQDANAAKKPTEATDIPRVATAKKPQSLSATPKRKPVTGPKRNNNLPSLDSSTSNPISTPADSTPAKKPVNPTAPLAQPAPQPHHVETDVAKHTEILHPPKDHVESGTSSQRTAPTASQPQKKITNTKPAADRSTQSPSPIHQTKSPLETLSSRPRTPARNATEENESITADQDAPTEDEVVAFIPTTTSQEISSPTSSPAGGASFPAPEAAPLADTEKDQNNTAKMRNAAITGDVSTITDLIAGGFDVNTTLDDKNNTPLIVAAIRRHTEIAELLLQLGANVNAANSSGDTPLTLAAFMGHTEIAELLLQLGANVNAANDRGKTPLTFAASRGHTEIAERLLHHGADVNAANSRGDTPLIMAAINGQKDIVQLLLQKPEIDVNAADSRGETPLTFAASRGHTEIAERLLHHGADVNAANSNGETPLIFAAFNGQKDIVQLLLQKPEIDVNAADSRGETPLTLAALNGQKDIVQLLLNHSGIDVNAANSRGKTPLTFAASRGHTEIAERLLHHGADVNAANSNGDTPLIFAALNGQKDIVQLLLNHSGIDVN